jgi:hypothetical protein
MMSVSSWWQDQVAVTGNEPTLEAFAAEWDAAADAEFAYRVERYEDMGMSHDEAVDQVKHDNEAEDAYYEAQAARGELAGVAETAPCYECCGFDGVHFVERKIVALGPVINPADPTQTYKLECGHSAF